MATDAPGDEFVTIVPVGENRLPGPPARDPAFVTVLTVGDFPGAAEVLVCRPRGARLGLGLKFEGGSAASERVRRLLVQSCAEDSPAANASTPWGKLIPGDEILAIDGISVSDLTRIDCVRRLKDSDETLRLLVRHFDKSKADDRNTDVAGNVSVKQTEIVRPTSLPPPVPPRKLGKKNSFKEKTCLQTVGEQNDVNLQVTCNQTHNGKDSSVNGQPNGMSTLTKLSRKSSFDSHLHRQTKESIACLRKGSPEEVRRLVRRLSDGKTIPPDAEVYIDLLSSEWERCLLLGDAESDDTGSSISTVVDRLGSIASSVENSIPSTPIMQPKTIDIQKVLNSIENIDSDILKDLTSNKFLENPNEPKPQSISKSNVQEITSQSGDLSQAQKNIQHNDRNNNYTVGVLESFVVKSVNPIKSTDEIDGKSDAPKVKPKPMPRSKVERSQSERKPRPILAPETPPPSAPEPLLTPTKKTCIETWLQRSEAEMKNKTIEKADESLAPEALPRLIDFVPKPQFKEADSESTLARPTTAPPPPPVETREDGSGASLDTIGELDECSDVMDQGKPITPVNETSERKSSFESGFWEDRGNKSDAEDKSLSNDETPLPSCPRQPPDGVETPSDVVEKVPDPPSRLPPRLPVGWSASRSRFSYASRLQDARSEASVKDKIAMFSNDSSTSCDQLDKCGTLPTNISTTSRKSTIPYTSNYAGVSSLDRRLTKSQENLDETPRTFKLAVDRPEVLGSVYNTDTNKTLVKNSRALDVENKPLFYGSTTTLPSILDNASFVQPVQPTYHTRSSSDDNNDKSQHKSNLEYLIEQRKKSMSKLRGLAIPDVQGPIIDLPEIKVQDNISKLFLFKSNHKDSNIKEQKAVVKTKPVHLNEATWKTNLLPNNIPKYSPAFKRKSLQVYSPTSLSKESTPERKFIERVDTLSKLSNLTNGTKLSRNSLDYKMKDRTQTSTLPSTLSSTISNKLPTKDYNDILRDVRDYKNVEIKICTATDVVDSDNDSAMSSTQSSYRSSASSPMHNIDTLESDSSHVSPRISHYTPYSLVKPEIPTKSSLVEKSCEDYLKRNVCRSISSDTNVSLSSSSGSAATSGSQASCSSLESSVADSDKRRGSKSYCIDTINRRNILASAKCRSGKDASIQSPVVETKFSHESDRSPSPTNNVSERLTTLTSTVSAVSNKGESRRRNKVIAESDSDSDSELNVRQRKSELKNTRLKRNSSTGKTKQNDSKPESPKSGDAPQVISEKILKEIKKAGLDNYGIAKPVVPDKKNVEIKKMDTKIVRSEIKTSYVSPVSNRASAAVVESAKAQISMIRKQQSEAKADPISSIGSTNKASTHIVRLKRGTASGVGLILAGGVDCEAKDVTVHRVLADSIAAKAGLKRGSKVRSINGCVMAGLTHAQSVAILKEQRAEVVIEIEDDTLHDANGQRCGSEHADPAVRGNTEAASDSSDVVVVVVEKAGGGAGLGFGLDGGRDSPAGDRPLTVKKLFAGGAAAQSGCIVVGAQLLAAGGQSLEGFTRTQAWAALKALPAGPVTLLLRNPQQPA